MLVNKTLFLNKKNLHKMLVNDMHLLFILIPINL